MRRDDRGYRRRTTAGAMLRHEALADRPPFSEALHERLVRRLPVAATPRRSPTVAAAAWPARLRIVMSLATVAGLVGMALLAARPDRAGTPAPPQDLMAAGTKAEAIGNGPLARDRPVTIAVAAEEPLGIDRLPLFDELQEEVRAGLTTLAVSLLEVPDLGPLAALAGAGLPDPGPPTSNATLP